MLVENTLFGTVDKVAYSIAQIRLHEPKEGYYVSFSGGKDSCVILALTKMAGVKFDAHYYPTTVDPPELVHFIKQKHPEVIFSKLTTNMWKLIEKKRMPPTRHFRYCCQVFKESHGMGRIVMTGVRKYESVRRSKRSMFEPCNKHKGTQYLHPIFNWTTDDVWQFINEQKLDYCSLYDEGYKRLGCVMCPFQSFDGMQRDMKRWPKLAAAYERACVAAYDKAIADGLERKRWKDGHDMFRWWIGQIKKPIDDSDMINIFGVIGDESIT